MMQQGVSSSANSAEVYEATIVQISANGMKDVQGQSINVSRHSQIAKSVCPNSLSPNHVHVAAVYNGKEALFERGGERMINLERKGIKENKMQYALSW